MLELSIAPPHTASPSISDPSAAGVEVWRQHDGAIAAYGGSAGHAHWMRVPGAGTFTFANSAPTVTAFPDPGVRLAVVEDAFRRSVLPMALQARGQEVLHASAVAGARGVFGLCAVSETGKSTLAYALSRRGYDVWADDALAFELADDGVTALSLPFSLYLRPRSAEYFGIPADAPAAVHGGDRRADLAALFVLVRAADDRAREPVRRLPQSDAFTAVLAHGYCFSLADVERKRAMMDAYLQLVTRVPIFEVRIAEGLERLPQLLDAIEAAGQTAVADAA